MKLTPAQVTASLYVGFVHPIGLTPRQRAREAALIIAADWDREPEAIASIQREIARIGDR